MDALKESLQPAQAALERFVLDPVNHDYLVLLKAMRNGIVYGCKTDTRMTLLFRTGSPKSKVLAILGATKQHATNLATFALCYKKEWSGDSFLAGVFAGFMVFGRGNKGKSSVNQQIVIYVFARVCLGLAKLAIAPRAKTHPPSGFQAGYSANRGAVGPGLLEKLLGGDENRAALWRKQAKRHTWAVFASVSWGLVMWLFRWYPELLQPSLRSSMTYLYEESERWSGLRDFLLFNR